MTLLRSLVLFAVAALAEIGGAWLVWQGVREQRGAAWIGAGIVALGAYGFVATLQPDAHFGRILAAYGGVFVAETLIDGRPVLFDAIEFDEKIKGRLPASARPDLSVDGTIELERLKDVLKLGRPAFGQANQTIGMFVLTADGTEAVRMPVRLGRNSVSTVEILEGLKEGDRVIISDTSGQDSNRVRLR